MDDLIFTSEETPIVVDATEDIEFQMKVGLSTFDTFVLRRPQRINSIILSGQKINTESRHVYSNHNLQTSTFPPRFQTLPDNNVSSSMVLPSSLSHCSRHLTPSYFSTWETFVLWCEGYILLPVGAAGAAGAVMAVAVLSAK